MIEKKFIGFDIGAESGRCVVGILNGDKISLNEVHRFETHSIKYENKLLWDIHAIYEEIIKGLINARKNFGDEFESIGIDTWGVDYVLVDSCGKITGLPYHYRDSRTDGMIEQAFNILSKEKIYSKAGIQFAQFNTLFQLLSEKPDLLRAADKMLLIPDLLNFLLTGIGKAELTIASTTSLVDPVSRNWSKYLIDKFELPEKIFPGMVEPGTVLGTLLNSVAVETGLNKNIHVIACTGHDTASAVVSIPAYKNSHSKQEVDWAFLSSGTWSLVGIELKQPVFTYEAMEKNFTNEVGYGNTIRFLKNIIGLWPVQECKRYWKEDSKDYSYPELASKAEQNGYAKAWVDLNDPRFLKPEDMPKKITSYLKETGQEYRSEPGFIIRVILESLAFSYKEAINEIESITSNKIKKLHAVGGGIKNELLTQLTANATGVDVIAGPVEGAIIGNIGVQAIASKAIKDVNEWRQTVSSSFELKLYNPKDTAYFSENELKYKSVLRT